MASKNGTPLFETKNPRGNTPMHEYTIMHAKLKEEEK